MLFNFTENPKTSNFQSRDRERDRFLAGYTFGNIYRAVAFIEVLKIPFEVHRSVLIFHTEFKVKELLKRKRVTSLHNSPYS